MIGTSTCIFVRRFTVILSFAILALLLVAGVWAKAWHPKFWRKGGGVLGLTIAKDTESQTWEVRFQGLVPHITHCYVRQIDDSTIQWTITAMGK